MALGDIHVRSAWQAWHKLTSTVVLRGRHGTRDRWHWVARLDWLGRALVARDAAAFCVAGAALGDIHVRSRSCGHVAHLPSFCVAGVGQMALGGALGLAWAKQDGNSG